LPRYITSLPTKSTNPTNKNVQKRQLLLLELVHTEQSYCLRLASIFHDWLIPYIKAMIHNPSIHNFHESIFSGFAVFYRKTIDRWLVLMEDIETELTLETITKRFLPTNQDLFDSQMANYVFICSRQGTSEFDKAKKEFEDSSIYKSLMDSSENSKMNLASLMMEPFQRLCRYQLLLKELTIIQTKIADSIADIEERKSSKSAKDIVLKSHQVISTFVNHCNTHMREEEERSLYQKVKYPQELVLGKNPDKTFLNIGKFNWSLKRGIDSLKSQNWVKLFDPADAKWTPIKLILCDTVLVFAKERQSEAEKSVMILEVKPPVLSSQLCEFITLHEFDKGQVSENFNPDTDIVLKVASSCYAELTTLVYGIRFGERSEADKFLNIATRTTNKSNSLVSEGKKSRVSVGRAVRRKTNNNKNNNKLTSLSTKISMPSTTGTRDMTLEQRKEVKKTYSYQYDQGKKCSYRNSENFDELNVQFEAKL